MIRHGNVQMCTFWEHVDPLVFMSQNNKLLGKLSFQKNVAFLTLHIFFLPSAIRYINVNKKKSF
jgi:hypothetical protein